MSAAYPHVFGRYVVLDELAAGGMAKVYRAKPIDGLRPVVGLKRLSDHVDESLKTMFIDEARIAAQLTHPNIAQTYDLGREDGRLFIAMELVWGRTVAEMLRAARENSVAIDYSIACSIVMRAAEGLDYAHRATGLNGLPLNIVHRDINPSNIMVSLDGEVKLIDFGVAKADSRLHQTTPGMVKGKLRYMAPEQILSHDVDGRADIFGLGLVLYELLTGHRAFDGSNPVIIFDRILNSEPENLPDGVPIGLRSIVQRAMAKKADHRFRTAGQFAEALAPFVVRDRSVIGAKDAALLMADIFPDARADMDARLRRYSEVQAVSYDIPKTVIAVTPVPAPAPPIVNELELKTVIAPVEAISTLELKTEIADPRVLLNPASASARTSDHAVKTEVPTSPTRVLYKPVAAASYAAPRTVIAAAITKELVFSRRGERPERRRTDRRSGDRRRDDRHVRAQRIMIRTLIAIAVISVCFWSSFLAYQIGRARGADSVQAAPRTELSVLSTNTKLTTVED